MPRAESSRKKIFVTESVSLTKELFLKIRLGRCYFQLIEIAYRGILGKFKSQLIGAKRLTKYAESLVYGCVSVFAVTEYGSSDMRKMSAYLMSASRIECDFNKGKRSFFCKDAVSRFYWFKTVSRRVKYLYEIS